MNFKQLNINRKKNSQFKVCIEKKSLYKKIQHNTVKYYIHYDMQRHSQIPTFCLVTSVMPHSFATPWTNNNRL